jgi:hypothetical protein
MMPIAEFKEIQKRVRKELNVFCWATKIAFLFGNKPTKRETERGCLFILLYFIN